MKVSEWFVRIEFLEAENSVIGDNDTKRSFFESARIDNSEHPVSFRVLIIEKVFTELVSFMEEI